MICESFRRSGALRWAHQAARGPASPERWTLQEEFVREREEQEPGVVTVYRDSEWRDVPTWEIPN